MDEGRIVDVAVAAARAAGELLLQHRRRELLVEAMAGNDLKLEVDRLAEALIVGLIREAFPDHDLLAEEGGAATGGGGYCWIIDPLDGTVNYFSGLPYYCTSIACYAKPARAGDAGLAALGRPVAGVVYAPPTDELFVGRGGGGGATLNGRPIQVGKVATARECMFCTGFGKDVERAREMAEVTRRTAERVRKLRCLGAAAYDLANVAGGRLDAFHESELRTWDIAAGCLILQEAGGQLTAIQTRPTYWRLLGAAAGVHDELLAMLAGDPPSERREAT